MPTIWFRTREQTNECPPTRPAAAAAAVTAINPSIFGLLLTHIHTHGGRDRASRDQEMEAIGGMIEGEKEEGKKGE